MLREPADAVSNMRPNEHCVARITDSIINVSTTTIDQVRLRYSVSTVPSPAPTDPPASKVVAASSAVPSTRLKNALAHASSSVAPNALVYAASGVWHQK